jgi:hypothetical protein
MIAGLSNSGHKASKETKAKFKARIGRLHCPEKYKALGRAGCKLKAVAELGEDACPMCHLICAGQVP